MRLFVERKARRFVGLAILLFCTLPFGLSMVGCGHKTAVVFCNAGDSGPVVGQVSTILLDQALATVGESVNFGQIGQSLSATATDCKGNAVTISNYTYSTTDMTIADVNPSTGQVCGGTWNRQTGSGIPDYTICTPPATTPTKFEAFITASAGGATSNAIPVFVHPVVTGIQLSTPSSSCSTDPTTDCCPNNTTAPEAPAPPYNGGSCVSQNNRVQLAAKIYANGKTDPADNITCKVGHLTFSAQGANNVVTIDAQGFATANQPGSTLITATVSNSTAASNAGFFSTCPPASIQLSAVGQGNNNPINVALNNTQPLTAIVKDTNGNTITGLSLEFNSTTPQTISASSGSILPTFPGSATITAVCQPGTCNPSPQSQIGYLGNGEPLTSNGITVNTAGTSGTVIYVASTKSQYVVPFDFTQNQQGAPIKLQFVPNSMVITQDGSAIYLGSPQGIMTIATGSNQASAANQAIPGTVLAVSPDGNTVVVTDPARQTVTLISSTGGIISSYGNLVGTRAEFTPDSQTVYITTTSNTLLSYSNFTNWRVTPTNTTYTDVAITVPSVGAYFAGKETDGRSYCSSTTVLSGTNPPATDNIFVPLADQSTAQTDRLAATTDGKHILGASVLTGAPVLSDLNVTLPVTTACPMPPNVVAPGFFKSAFTTHPLTGVAASAITGVDPASNSNIAFITYTGSGGVLPFYLPGTGALNSVPLSNGATAPISGVFSTDNQSFYTGTSGDNDVHVISVTGTSAKESGTIIAPKLTGPDGTTIVAPDMIVQRPKKLQS